MFEHSEFVMLAVFFGDYAYSVTVVKELLVTEPAKVRYNIQVFKLH
jgi:hypothetical protein